MSNTAIIIDESIKAMLPPLSHDERQALEASITSTGCLSPLVAWKETNVLLDGHNRYEICQQHHVSYSVSLLSFASRDLAEDWVDEQQIGRRNLTKDQLTILQGRRYNRTKKPQGGTGANQYEQSGKSCHSAKTAATLAKQHGVSEKTIRNAGQFASAVEKLKSVEPDLERKIVANEPHAPRSAIVKAAKLLDTDKEQAKDVLNSGKKLRKAVAEVKAVADAKALKEAKAEISKSELSEVCDIRHCSMAELLKSGIKPDAIITDPPYPKEYLHVYGELAELSKDVPLVAVMVGQTYLPQIFADMCKHLTYRWTLAYLTPGAALRQWQAKVDCTWKPVLLFGKAVEYVYDVCTSEKSDKEHHEWGQSESGMVQLIERLTKPGQLVCDPFLGGGTTAVVSLALGRRFVGCDTDKQCVARSRERCKAVKP